MSRPNTSLNHCINLDGPVLENVLSHVILSENYNLQDYFYLGSNLGMDTDQMDLGVGKMFSFSGNVYVDPRLV